MLFEKHVYERQNRFLYCFITTKQRDKDLTLLNHWVNFIPGLAWFIPKINLSPLWATQCNPGINFILGIAWFIPGIKLSPYWTTGSRVPIWINTSLSKLRLAINFSRQLARHPPEPTTLQRCSVVNSLYLEATFPTLIPSQMVAVMSCSCLTLRSTAGTHLWSQETFLRHALGKLSLLSSVSVQVYIVPLF